MSPAHKQVGAASMGRGLIVVVASVVCAACFSSRPDVAAPPVPETATAALDASYDWHGLVRVPFHTLLKDSPVPLHEVLLFHEETPPPEIEINDCHAIDGTQPRFVGRAAETYLLCFDHDRLSRIEASVRLPVAEAPGVLARACTLWSKQNAASTGAPCEGRDGGIAYSAHLILVPGEDAGTLSIMLLDVVPPP